MKIKRVSDVLETTAFPLDPDGCEWDIPVRIEYLAWEEPAQLTGPWENCHPGDGGMEITRIEVLQDWLPGGMVEADVTDWVRHNCMDDLWEHFKEAE